MKIKANARKVDAQTVFPLNRCHDAQNKVMRTKISVSFLSSKISISIQRKKLFFRGCKIYIVLIGFFQKKVSKD